MDDDSGLGILLGIVFVLSVIMMIVSAIVMVILGIAAVGSVVGAVISVMHFVTAVKQVAGERKSLKGFANESKQAQAEANTDWLGLVFEEYGSKMYILSPIFSDIFAIVRYAFSINFEYRMDFSNTDKDSKIGTVIAKAFVIGKGLSVYIFGTLFTIVICGLFLILSAIGAVVVLPITGIVFCIESIYFKAKQINFRCGVCKKEYKLPIFICPKCGVYHSKLMPGVYGMFKRTCLCGARLPVLAVGKGYASKVDSDGTMYREEIKYDSMRSLCPYCHSEGGIGLSHAISIALIGGSACGKTTFKVAFEHDLVCTEAPSYGIVADFPDKDSQDEYTASCRYYEGKDIVPSTNSTDKSDISTFCINLKSNSFVSDRMLQIYDLPGEHFTSGDAKESWEHYSFTEGAVFIIDPFSIEKMKKSYNSKLASSTMGICNDDMNVMIDKMIETLSNVKVKKTGSGKMKIPVALTLGKVDSELLDSLCGDLAAERLMQGSPDVFTNKYDAMDYACRCFLSDGGYDNFIQNIDNNFETVHFFSCSAVGSMPTTALRSFAPRHVTDIIRWLVCRADKKNLGSVWNPQKVINDIPEDRKKLYKDNRTYYDEYVLKAITVSSV